MKRIIALMSGALLLVAGLCASCQKELGSQDEKSTTVDEVVVKATIAGNDTKVSFVVDGNNLKTTWQEDDHIVGWDAAGNAIELEVASLDNNNKTAIFKTVTGSSPIPTADNSKVYMIYAPGKDKSHIENSSLEYVLSDQGSGKLPALMTATGEVSNNVLTLTFTNQLAIVAVQNPKFDVSAATNITGLKLSGDNILTKATFSVDENNALKMSSSVDGDITRSCNITTAADGTTTNTMVYFAVLPNDTQADVTISTTAPTPGYQIVCTGKTFTAGNCYLLDQKDIDKQTFSITVADGITGGSITTSPSGSVAWGTSVTVTATPNTGYELTLNSIAVTGATSGNINVTDNKFTMPEEAVTISGSFQKVYYDIAKADATHGSFTVKKGDTEVSTANYEDEITIETNPDSGYIVDKISYTPEGGNETDITSDKKFSMPASDVTVTVTFKPEIPGTLPEYTIETW